MWVKLNERTKYTLLKNYYRGWDYDHGHLSGFATRLDREQKELENNNVEVTDVTKMQYYMLQIWDTNMFSRKVMMTWTVHPEANKTYANAVLYFNKEMEKLKIY